MMMWQPGQTLADIEKAVILMAYSFYHGNKTKTAQSLGIAIRTLDNKLEKYNGVSSSGGIHVEPSSKDPQKQ